jgi:hypothetical protein
MRRFAESCASRDQHCVVLLLPDADEIESRRQRRRDPVEEVLRPIAEEIETWDPTDYFVEQSRELGVCHHFGPDSCYGHYNVDGNAVLARYVAERVAAVRRESP